MTEAEISKNSGRLFKTMSASLLTDLSFLLIGLQLVRILAKTRSNKTCPIDFKLNNKMHSHQIWL